MPFMKRPADCSGSFGRFRKGLSVLDAEWLQSQDRFDAPTEMKVQIEANIESNRGLLQQATTSLEFA
ncbi:hypothetical protein JTL34_35375, partial [Pseudomonas aeruginosa]|nr:hypothetical protein [Pseudomonas aeruginosa]